MPRKPSIQARAALGVLAGASARDSAAATPGVELARVEQQPGGAAGERPGRRSPSATRRERLAPRAGQLGVLEQRERAVDAVDELASRAPAPRRGRRPRRAGRSRLRRTMPRSTAATGASCRCRGRRRSAGCRASGGTARHQVGGVAVERGAVGERAEHGLERVGQVGEQDGVGERGQRGDARPARPPSRATLAAAAAVRRSCPSGPPRSVDRELGLPLEPQGLPEGALRRGVAAGAPQGTPSRLSRCSSRLRSRSLSRAQVERELASTGASGFSRSRRCRRESPAASGTIGVSLGHLAQPLADDQLGRARARAAIVAAVARAPRGWPRQLGEAGQRAAAHGRQRVGQPGRLDDLGGGGVEVLGAQQPRDAAEPAGDRRRRPRRRGGGTSRASRRRRRSRCATRAGRRSTAPRSSATLTFGRPLSVRCVGRGGAGSSVERGRVPGAADDGDRSRAALLGRRGSRWRMYASRRSSRGVVGRG